MLCGVEGEDVETGQTLCPDCWPSSSGGSFLNGPIPHIAAILPEQSVRAEIPLNFQGLAENLTSFPQFVHVDPKRFSWLQCDE